MIDITKLKIEFESIKRDIDELKLRKISDDREREKLEIEKNELKEQIRKEYGVDPELFEEFMSSLENEIEKEKDILINEINKARLEINE